MADWWFRWRALRADRTLMVAMMVALSMLVGVVAPGFAQSLAKSPLIITTASGGVLRWTVEVAATPEEQARGLMFRQRLADDAGMLFPNPTPRVASFWMKNTLIPLDMVFIDAKGVITGVHAKAVPGSLEAISSGVPVKAVLEINGGMAARLGIRAGDKVDHPIFKP